MREREKKKNLSSKPEFFHKFSLFDRYFVFFPISGSLIEVDEYTFLNLEKDNENLDQFFYEEKKIWEEYDVKFDTPQNLKSICLLISQKCNFKCDYCFVHEGKYNEKESLMDKEISFKAVDFLIENSKTKNVEIDFFGGEPLLNWDVVKETIEYGYKVAKENGKRIRFSLTTNGALINDDRLNFLIENSVSLIISLDGPKEINDIHRKLDNERGTFDLIFEKIKKIKNYKGYYIRGTFTNKTKEIFKSALFFYENGFKNISLEPVILEEENPLCLKEKDIEDVMLEYEKLGKYIYEEKLKGNLLNFYHFHVDLSEGPCLGKMSFGCGAGVEYLAVDSKGDLYPCHFLKEFEEFKMGNVFDGIDKDKKNYFIEINKLDSKEKCKSCWAKYLCGGGCIAHFYFLNKDPNIPREEFCELQKKRLEIGLFLNSL